MDWIIFRQPDKRIAVIDDERYRVFAEDDGGNIGELLVDNPHDLRYCPARFFWNEPMNLREPDVKQSPLTKELEALDWFLFSIYRSGIWICTGRTRYIPVTNNRAILQTPKTAIIATVDFERQTRVLQVRPSRVIDALPQVRRQTDYRGGFLC